MTWPSPRPCSARETVADIRVGLGFDSHPRDDSRPLFLGGVAFEGHPGLGAHSDGDVVCHAVGDALLGAAALDDLGTHFPDSDPAFAGMSGGELLGRVVAMLDGRGLAPSSCDVVVLAASPHIAPRREEIRASLARILRIPAERVSVKGSRPEGLGLTGDGAACLALAVIDAR